MKAAFVLMIFMLISCVSNNRIDTSNQDVPIATSVEYQTDINLLYAEVYEEGKIIVHDNRYEYIITSEIFKWLICEISKDRVKEILKKCSKKSLVRDFLKSYTDNCELWYYQSESEEGHKNNNSGFVIIGKDKKIISDLRIATKR